MLLVLSTFAKITLASSDVIIGKDITAPLTIETNNINHSILNNLEIGHKIDEISFLEKKFETSEEDTINISNYNYPLPENEENERYTIAIFATSDIHGTALKKYATHPATKVSYSYGGLDIMASQINALKEEWGDRLIWLDAGDQFQGGFETKLSNGSIITDFFNNINLKSSAIGNHEFDFGQDFLRDRLSKANFTYLAANIEDDNHQKEFLNNMKTRKVFNVGKIKVGVIGLSTLATPKTTSGDLKGFNFTDYVPAIISEAKLLRREDKVDAIILTSHIGTRCKNNDLNVNKLRYYTPEVDFECNLNDQEMNQLVNAVNEQELKDGVVYLDAVVAGHTHMNTHHFIKGKPVVSTVNNGLFFNVIYLKFKIRKNSSNNLRHNNENINKVEDSKSQYELIKEKTVIEGPVPVCEKVFSNKSACTRINDDDKNVGQLASVLYHKKLITPNPKIKEIFDYWEDQMKPYFKVLVTSDVRLKIGNNPNSQLGNLYADCYNKYTTSDFAVINSGSFRTEWNPGNITLVDLYDMSPFVNKIFKFDIKGSDVVRLMKVIHAGDYRPYPIGGLKIKIKSTFNPEGKDIYEVTDVTLADGSLIDNDKIYKMSTGSFLIQNYGDDFRKVKDWLTPEKLEDFGSDREFIQKCLTDLKIITTQTSVDKRVEITKSK